MVGEQPRIEETGEPGPELILDHQTVQPGDVVHIVLHGPTGGTATAELVPLSAGSATAVSAPERR